MPCNSSAKCLFWELKLHPWERKSWVFNSNFQGEQLDNKELNFQQEKKEPREKFMLFLSLYPYRRRDFQGWNAPCSHWPRSLVQGLCVAAVQVNDSGGLLFLLFEVDTAVIPWAGSSWSHARNLGLSHIPMPIISPTPCAASIILTQKHHLGSKDNTNPCCRKKKTIFFSKLVHFGPSHGCECSKGRKERRNLGIPLLFPSPLCSAIAKQIFNSTAVLLTLQQTRS